MEFLFEWFIQIVLQFIGELIFEGVSAGVQRASKTRIGRVVLFMLFSMLPALGVGYLWGNHVESIGQTAQPRSMWISLAVALVLIALAVQRRDNTPTDKSPRFKRFQLTPTRLTMLAITNITAAAGMAWAFNT